MTEIKTNSDTLGQVQIADEVISVIAGTAAMEVDGVACTGGSITNDIAGMLGKKNFAKGIKIDVSENGVSIEVVLTVKFGYKVQDVAYDVQKRMKTAVETMTGLMVSEINVFVVAVYFDKEKK